MTAEAGDLLDRLTEVSRLSTLLANRMLAAQAADQLVLKAHMNALLDAANILHKFEVYMPASLDRMIDQINDAEAEEAGLSDIT